MASPGANPASTRPRVVAGLRLVRLVGRGGEGEVWEARTGGGAARALKLIRPDALVDPEELERRGRWLRAVDHPALVAVDRTGVLAGGGLDGWAFVEMPFLDGSSLEDVPPDPDVLERLALLADALDALHDGEWSGGVPLVHRDVKPANLIDVGDRLVLVDHSTLRDASAETVTRIGTPVYAAPEVSLGRAGPPADVYAFAATAVALLTGARGRELARLLADPWALDVPEGLRAALAPDPHDRPASCRAALANDPATARAPVEPRAGALEPVASAPVWRWVAVLGLVALAPTGALAVGMPPWPHAAAAAAAAIVLHLLAHTLGRGPRVLRWLAPPLAWAWLLADRAAPDPRRRAYARAVLTGTLLAGTAGAGWGAAATVAPALVDGGTIARALVDGGTIAPALPLAVAAGALALTAVGVATSRHGGVLLGLVLLPAWLVGASALTAGALALAPLAVLPGRGRAALRLAWETSASLVEALRPRGSVTPS